METLGTGACWFVRLERLAQADDDASGFREATKGDRGRLQSGVYLLRPGKENQTRMLMQEGHQVAYESRKLIEAKCRYTVQEMEMTVIVHCIWTWQHYLLGSKFMDSLAEYNNVPEYKPGQANSVADVLSWKAEIANILSRPECMLLDRIKEGLRHDAKAKALLDYAREGKTRRFQCDGNLLYTKGHRFYVPLRDKLRREVLHKVHDFRWVGHPGVRGSLALVEERTSRSKLIAKWLEPLPILERLWESVSMDFIVSLSKFEGYQTLIVVLNRFSKYATFIPATNDCLAEEAAKLFMKHVVNPMAYKFSKSWQEEADLTRSCFDKGVKRMKKWADTKCRHTEEQVGDLVIVKLHQILRHKGVHKGLVWHYEGPFQVIERVKKVAYKLELPKKLKLHPLLPMTRSSLRGSSGRK
ncbi:hypothetical protein CRG98_016327 [Punica granatum]|uniref:Uncharacterized protein n=1 Tax=Punica granatum TaxID=22663 RepID=A0A2I0K415_PUNGR|nr:hypothetical protein CRG98_016327 [Punica granatum]